MSLIFIGYSTIDETSMKLQSILYELSTSNKSESHFNKTRDSCYENWAWMHVTSLYKRLKETKKKYRINLYYESIKPIAKNRKCLPYF